jgi:DNA repair exonuclease SbcCD ATPase subunit
MQPQQRQILNTGMVHAAAFNQPMSIYRFAETTSTEMKKLAEKISTAMTNISKNAKKLKELANKDSEKTLNSIQKDVKLLEDNFALEGNLVSKFQTYLTRAQALYVELEKRTEDAEQKMKAAKQKMKVSLENFPNVSDSYTAIQDYDDAFVYLKQEKFDHTGFEALIKALETGLTNVNEMHQQNLVFKSQFKEFIEKNQCLLSKDVDDTCKIATQSLPSDTAIENATEIIEKASSNSMNILKEKFALLASVSDKMKKETEKVINVIETQEYDEQIVSFQALLEMAEKEKQAAFEKVKAMNLRMESVKPLIEREEERQRQEEKRQKQEEQRKALEEIQEAERKQAEIEEEMIKLQMEALEKRKQAAQKQKERAEQLLAMKQLLDEP